ncbi:MAG: hypothetical protein ACPG7M_00930, partial [Paracoccaceae bacterium]
DAVLCKGLHLEGEDKRSFAIDNRGIRFAVCAQGLLHLIVPICAKDVIYLEVFKKFQFTPPNAK